MNPFPGRPAVATLRLDLCPLTAVELDALISGCRLSGWAPDFPQPLDSDAATVAFQAGLFDAAQVLAYRLIRERDGGLAIGTVGFTGLPVAGTVELSFSVVPSRRRQGFGREAVEAVVRSALAAPGIHTVMAYTAADNAASRALLLSAGFRPATREAVAADPGIPGQDVPGQDVPGQGTVGFELRAGWLQPPASFAAAVK